jgi:hypothetical protein
MRLEVKHVLVPFLDFLHEFDPKRAHMMLVLMFDLKFKGLFIELCEKINNHNFNNKV